MTKNEKIAISVSAVIGFGLFCFVLVAVLPPLAFLTGYLFGNNTRFARVEKERLPYAVGEDYVFLSQEFFDECSNLTICDSGISVRFSDKRWNEVDTTFSQPVRNAQEYGISFYISNDEYKDFSGYFSCRRASETIFPYDDYSYGDYSYNKHENYSSIGGEIYFSFYATTDSGSHCELSVIFDANFDVEEDSVKLEKYRAQCVEIFEKMLDNIVGYEQCISGKVNIN